MFDELAAWEELQGPAQVVKTFTLHPYQEKLVSGCRTALGSGQKRLIAYLPTGGGKTIVAMGIVKMAQEKGKRVAFICNRVQLIQQTSENFTTYGIKHGIIQGANTRDHRADVVVASIQTIAKRGMDDYDLLILDECHACAGTKAYAEIMRGKVTVGLTATPYQKGLGRVVPSLGGPLFESIVAGVTMRELIGAGYLVDADVWAPADPDLRGVKTVAGDYQEDQLGEAMDKAQLVGDIVSHWLKLAPGTQTMVFAVNIAHSRHICDQFKANGIAAVHVDYHMTDEEKQAIYADFKAGRSMVLCNCALLSEGSDFPACETLILARPTKSKVRYVQMFGRSIRTHDNISECYASYRSYRDGIQGSYAVENGRLSGEHRGDSCCFEMRGSEKVVIPTLEQSERILFDKEGARIPANIQPREGQGGARELPYGDYSRGELQRSPASCDGMAEGGKRDPSGESQGWEQAEQSRRQSGVGYESGKQETRASAWVVPGDQWRESRQEQANAGSGDRNKAGIEGLSSWIIDETGTKVRSADDNHIGDKGWKVLGACFIAESQEEVESLAKLLSRCHKGNEALLVCSSTENTGRAVRVVGARRLKKKAIVLDHSGAVKRLGFPWDFSVTHLDDGKPKKSSGGDQDKPEPLPKPCPNCHYMKPPRTPVCPSCGFESRMPNEVETAEGELVQLRGKKPKAQTRLADMGKPSVYGQLCQIAKDRQKSEKWILAQYKGIFGTWPRQEYRLEPPSPELLSWIHSRNIAWAKSQRSTA